MVASIVANKGFIRQFAAKGQAKINPSWVSSFGGIYSAGQVIGQFSIQFVADGFGRKMAMYTFIVGLIIVSGGGGVNAHARPRLSSASPPSGGTGPSPS